MRIKGSFRLTSLQNNKYIWQYISNNDTIQHVIRPIHSSTHNFWELFTNNDFNNKKIDLLEGDSFYIDSINIIDNDLHITLTWLINNTIWNTIKNSPLAKSLNKIENVNLKNIKNIQDVDDTLDKAVLFCNKITNSLQILQDKINTNSNISNKDISNNNLFIEKKITYIGYQD